LSAFAAVSCALLATKKTPHPSVLPTHSPQGEGKGADETFELIQKNLAFVPTMRVTDGRPYEWIQVRKNLLETERAR
jgi:hypothetical protein